MGMQLGWCFRNNVYFFEALYKSQLTRRHSLEPMLVCCDVVPSHNSSNRLMPYMCARLLNNERWWFNERRGIHTSHSEWDEESGTCAILSRLSVIWWRNTLPINNQYRRKKNLVLGLKGKFDLGPSG